MTAPTVEITTAQTVALLERAADHVAEHGWIQGAYIDDEYTDITKSRTCAAGAIEVVGAWLTPGLTRDQHQDLIDHAQAVLADWLTGRGAARKYSAEQTIARWNDRQHRRKRHVVNSLRLCAKATRGGAA